MVIYRGDQMTVWAALEETMVKSFIDLIDAKNFLMNSLLHTCTMCSAQRLKNHIVLELKLTNYFHRTYMEEQFF